MGKTYQNIPIATKDILSELVAEVSTNLASESTLDIGQVSFMYGTLKDVNNEIASQQRDPVNKSITFPLVIFLLKSDEKFTDQYNSTLELEILICNGTKTTYSNDDRYTYNFLPILYPIYAELKEAIGRSKYFWGYKRMFGHTKTDLPHAGQDSANGPVAYDFSTPIDAVMLSNVSLKVSRPKCAYVAPNLCLLTPCPYGREAYYENAIKGLTIEGVGSNTLRASVTSYYFVDSSGGLPPPFAPEIDWGDGSPVSAMTVPSPPNTVPFTSVLNTALLQDGSYIGRISFDDSWIDFYYLVASGIVVKCTSSVALAYDFDLSCALYPNQPINSTMTYTISKVDGQSNVIAGYTYDVFNVQKFTESINPTVGTITKTMQYTAPFTTANYAVAHKVSYGGQQPLQVVFQIKTQCKTEF